MKGVDIMSQYKVEIQGSDILKYPQLTHQETMTLLNQYQQNHQEEIKEKLVLSNLKLVLSLAQRYNNNQNIEDLFQVGIIGLIKAIENFNTSLDVRFSTYAVPLILGEMKRYKRDNSSLRIPRTLRDLAYQAMQAHDKYVKKNNKEPSSRELSQILNVDEYLLTEALSSTHSVASLSQEVQNDGNGAIDLESQIPDRHSEIEELHNRLDLDEALHHLNQQELQIIQERYYQGHTQAEIAKELFISQAQVSRLEKQALSRLRKYMG